MKLQARFLAFDSVIVCVKAALTVKNKRSMHAILMTLVNRRNQFCQPVRNLAQSGLKSMEIINFSYFMTREESSPIMRRIGEGSFTITNVSCGVPYCLRIFSIDDTDG